MSPVLFLAFSFHLFISTQFLLIPFGANFLSHWTFSTVFQFVPILCQAISLTFRCLKLKIPFFCFPHSLYFLNYAFPNSRRQFNFIVAK